MESESRLHCNTVIASVAKKRDSCSNHEHTLSMATTSNTYYQSRIIPNAFFIPSSDIQLADKLSTEGVSDEEEESRVLHTWLM